MDHDAFMRHVECCQRIWREFKGSFQDPSLAAFLRESYPVLCHAREEVPPGSMGDAQSIAMHFPESFIPRKMNAAFITHVICFNSLKNEVEWGSKNKRILKRLAKVKKWLRDFDLKRLEFEEYRLEVRFSTLKSDLIQKIKRSCFVDLQQTDLSRESIRVVLQTDEKYFSHSWTGQELDHSYVGYFRNK